MRSLAELHEHALSRGAFPALAVDPDFRVGWLHTDGNGAESIAASFDLRLAGLPVFGPLCRRAPARRRRLRRWRTLRWNRARLGRVTRAERLHRFSYFVRFEGPEQHALCDAAIPPRVNR